MPDETEIAAGAPACAVALNEVVIAVPCTVAVTLNAPAVVPRVTVLLATPDELVTEVAEPKVPEPEATAQVTVTPDTTWF